MHVPKRVKKKNQKNVYLNNRNSVKIISRSINQSIDQSINQSTLEQKINPGINQSSNQTHHKQTHRQSINQSINQSTNQSNKTSRGVEFLFFFTHIFPTKGLFAAAAVYVGDGVQPGQQYPLLRGPARYVDPVSEKKKTEALWILYCPMKGKRCARWVGHRQFVFWMRMSSFAVCLESPHGTAEAVAAYANDPWGEKTSAAKLAVFARLSDTYTLLNRYARPWLPWNDCRQRRRKKNIVNVSDRVWNIKCAGTFFGSPPRYIFIFSVIIYSAC